MSKQIVKRSGGKLARSKPAPLEPLASVAREEASVMDWIRRFEALPLKQKNQAIRENKEFARTFYGNLVLNGNLLLNALRAEHEGDDDKGEHTFLTILKPLREQLVRDYQIRTAAEFMLVDVVVLSYYQYLRAATCVHEYIAYGKSYSYEVLVRYAQPYLARANELFLRNLQALREMKALPFVVKIEQAGQVNLGEKQVNVTAGAIGGGAGTARVSGAGGPPALPSTTLVAPAEADPPPATSRPEQAK